MKNKDLKVTPIKRYNVPKYPSHSDKSPLEYPETLPYPFRTKVVYGLVLTGLFTSITLNNSNLESPKNPFPLALTGLPHTPSSFGTGLPSRLNSKEAKNIIFKVFQEEGLQLKKNYLFKKGENTYELDGYDEKTKIGFAWLNNNNLNVDNYNYYDRPSNGYINSFPYYLRNKNEDEEVKEYSKRVKNLKTISDKNALKKAKDALKYEITAWIITKNVLEEISKTLKTKAKESFKLNGQAQQKAFEYIHFRLPLEQYISRYPTNNNKTFVGFIKKNINQFDTQTLKKYINVIKELSKYHSSNISEDGQKDLMKIMDNFSANPDLSVLMDQLSHIDEERFSQKELKGLKEQAKQDKIFIAPISTYDSRFQYHGYKSEYMISQKERKQIEEAVQDIGDIKKRAKAKGDLINKALESMPDPKENTLRDLENQVRGYIQWAKSQGRF
jgi:hypothetical protein